MKLLHYEGFYEGNWTAGVRWFLQRNWDAASEKSTHLLSCCWHAGRAFSCTACSCDTNEYNPRPCLSSRHWNCSLESRHPHTALKLNSFHCISTYHREWMEHGKSASNRNWMFLHSKISIIVIDGNESFHMKVFRLYRQLYNCWQFMSYDMTYNEELIRAKLTRKIESIHINIT